MALTGGELAQILWAETKLFGPGAADGSGPLNFVRLSIAQLAASTAGAGFDRREPVPSVADPDLGAAAKQALEIAERAVGAAAPQPRLIVWPAGTETAKLNGRTDPPPPEPWASLDPAGLAKQMRLQIADVGALDVFSRAPVAGDDGPAFVNWLSGTGLPDRNARGALADADAEAPRPISLAWTLGILGVCLFVLAGLVSGVTGASMAAARNSLTTTSPAYQRALILRAAQVCAQDRADLPSATRAKLCETLLPGEQSYDPGKPDDVAKALAKSDDALKIVAGCAEDSKGESCMVVWRASVAEVQGRDWRQVLFRYLLAVSSYVTGAGADDSSISVVVPYYVTLAGVALLIVALGLGTRGRMAGVWIDTRNRVSLARAQVTIWTVVVLGAHFVLAMFNIGFAGVLETLGDFVSGKYAAFPSFPAPIAAALGIAGGSTMLSALILPTKDKGPILNIRGAVSDLSKRGAPFFGNQSTGLDKHPSPAQASISDVFMGEENANADSVDVARLQNVVMTISLAIGYVAFLVSMMSDVRTATLLGGHDAIFSGLPDPGANFAWLLAVSHAAYLVAKAHDPQDHGPETGSPPK